jgi:hypothetical protein
MRKLSAKQKKMLDEYYKNIRVNFCSVSRNILTVELMQKLEAVYDYELIAQDAERYIRDKIMEE